MKHRTKTASVIIPFMWLWLWVSVYVYVSVQISVYWIDNSSRILAYSKNAIHLDLNTFHCNAILHCYFTMLFYVEIFAVNCVSYLFRLKTKSFLLYFSNFYSAFFLTMRVLSS